TVVHRGEGDSGPTARRRSRRRAHHLPPPCPPAGPEGGAGADPARHGHVRTASATPVRAGGRPRPRQPPGERRRHREGRHRPPQLRGRPFRSNHRGDLAGDRVTAGTASRALRVNPAALGQRIDQQLRHHRAEPHTVILVRAGPVRPHEPTLTTAAGRRLRVVPCVSTLAVWEQLTQPRDTALVLLTDLTERDLGPGILSGVFRQRIITVEPWDLVAEVFGAQRLDPQLRAEAWAGEALLDAMPAEGWPRLAGTVLSRDHALRHLAAARLGLDRLGLGPEDLDARALLRWSGLPGAAELVRALREPERVGLANWLIDTCGKPAQAVLALLEAGHLADALPLGPVCAAIWSADDPDALRAQGRIEQYFGPSRPDPGAIRAYAALATDSVTDLLRSAPTSADYQAGMAVLDRAEELLLQFGAVEAARGSLLLRTGFHHRADLAAAAIQDALSGRTPDLIAAAERAV